MLRTLGQLCKKPSLFDTRQVSNIGTKGENKTPDFESDAMIKEKALSIIFGPTPYKKLSNSDRILVDLYQDWEIKRDGGMVLPNTKYSTKN